LDSSKLDIGDILFVRDSNPLSRTIRWVTKSNWSHVAFYIGEGQVLDTDAFHNVSIRHLDVFEEWEAKRVDGLTDQEIGTMVTYLVGQLKKPYDYLQIIGFFIEAIFGISNQWSGKEKFSCGKLIDTAFAQIDKDVCPDKVAGDVTPEDLYRSPLLRGV
jgi:cell wall-associated NlpC family hydrolase